VADYFTKKDAEELKEEITKIIEKSIEENRKEFQRYIGIVSEDFQHKLNFVIDVQVDIKRDVAGLKTDVAGLKTDVAGLKTDVAGLKTDVAGLKTDVAGLKTKTDVIYSELVSHRDNTELHAQKAKRKKAG